MIPGSCPAKAMVGRGVKVGRRLGVRELLWKEDVSQEESRQARAGLSRRSLQDCGGGPVKEPARTSPRGEGHRERGGGACASPSGVKGCQREQGARFLSRATPGRAAPFPVLGLRRKSGLSRGRRRPWAGCAHLAVPWDTAPVTQ